MEVVAAFSAFTHNGGKEISQEELLLVLNRNYGLTATDAKDVLNYVRDELGVNDVQPVSVSEVVDLLNASMADSGILRPGVGKYATAARPMISLAAPPMCPPSDSRTAGVDSPPVSRSLPPPDADAILQRL